MGYDLHITRRENWFDEGDDIALDEWLVVAQADPDLTVAEDGSADMRGPKEQLWPLWWYDGVVQTKNPEVGLIAKMVALAGVLGAKVQGDEGETYAADGSSDWGDEAPAPKKGWLARLLGR
ncbi:hypothetical protein [Vannielia litorea]|uniref:hypothetical protein n=1 Tax=Vannielia litorea TaxID=1217970 RepID=UPI001BCDE136|nr:hypothetical protein [Vannielia litorea]